MNSFEFMIVICIPLYFSTPLFAEEFRCDALNTIVGGFRAINSDIYIFSKSGYLSKLKSYENGEWFRVYDGYPKFLTNWTKEDFNASINDVLVFYGAVADEVHFKEFGYRVYKYVFKWNPLMQKYVFKQRMTISVEQFLHCAIIKDTVSIKGNSARRRCHAYDAQSGGCTQIIDEKEVTDNGTAVAHVVFLESPIPCTASEKAGTMIALNTSNGSYGYSFQDQYSVPLYVQPKKPKLASTTFTLLKTKLSDSVYVSYDNDEFPTNIHTDRKLVVHNNLWFGCPVVDCMRIFIDAATKTANQKVLLFMGKYVYEVSSIDEKPQNPREITSYFGVSVESYVDAVFTNRKTNLVKIIKNRRMWIFNAKNSTNWTLNKELETSSKECHGSVENAVFNVKANNFYMFCGNSSLGDVWAYDSKDKPINKKSILSINSNLPKSIDAAFTHPENDDIILMKNNFAVRIENEMFFKKVRVVWLNEQFNSFHLQTSEMPLLFRQYFGCKNESFADLFTDVDAAAKYERLTRPMKDVEAPPKKNNGSILENNAVLYVAVIIAFIICFIMLVIAVISYINCEKQSTISLQKDSPSTKGKAFKSDIKSQQKSIAVASNPVGPGKTSNATERKSKGIEKRAN
ncbi:hypothetical protein B4U80_13131 [Leptotrombidium deliense]|uniref:Uncharacterized protein n=1 Tax=Leptotrombidium deliense TaxID=299467 RepID=A0A443SC28_9ACAR|nr:hypothetical protein B4U80_13131 [Leptotrombidium deliense]